MAVSKANQRAVNKYVKNNYDRINVTMPKGKKDMIQAHAEANGESVNGFINRAIDQTMAQEAVESRTRPASSEMTLDIAEGGNSVIGPSDSRTEGISGEGGS